MDGPRDYILNEVLTYSIVYTYRIFFLRKEKRQIPYDITYMWNLKYDTNERIYETETDLQT